MAKKRDEISKESAEAAQLITQAYKDGNITLSQQDRLLDKILNKQLKGADAVSKAVAAAEKEKDVIEGKNKLLERKQSLEEKSIKQNEDLTKILTDQRKNTKDLVDDFVEMADLSDKQAESKLKEIQAQKKQLKQQFSYRNLTWQQKDAYSEILRNLEQQEGVLTNLSKLQDNKQAQALAASFDKANDKVDEMQSNLTSVFDNIPGGGMLGNVLGVDKFGDQMKKQVIKSFAAMNASIAAGGGLMQGLKTAMAGFNKIVMVNPLLLVVAAGAALFAILSKNEEMANDLAQSSGMDFATSKKLVESTRSRSEYMTENLSTTKDLLAVQTESLKVLGAAGKLTQENAVAVSETGKSYGYGAQKAGEVNAAFMKLGANQNEAARVQKELAATAYKEGLNMQSVMDDVAQNSLAASKYMGSNVEEITKAAVQAAKLGLSLGDLTGIADGLLSIEDSLSAQFEFQALSGKQINLDKARQLALDGDLEGMAKAIAEEAGNIHEFNKMGRFEKEKLAKSMGMEVGQLQEMLAMEEARSSHGKIQADQAAALGITAAEMNEMSNEELEAKIASQQSAEKLSATMSRLADTLTSFIMPVAQAFGDVLNFILDTVNFLLWPFRAVASAMESTGKAGQVVLGIIQGMAVGYLIYLGYQKISNMLAARKKKKTDQEKITQGQLARAELDIAEAKAESNDKAQEAVDLAEDHLKTEEKVTNQMKTQNKVAKKGNDLAAKQAEQAASGGGTKRKGLGGLMDKGKGLLGQGKKLLTGKNLMMAGGLLTGGMAMFGGGGDESPEGEGGTDMSMDAMAGRGAAYADGGTVANTGIAQVHTGEKIVPASKVPGSEPKGGGGGASIDYDKMTQAFIAAMQQMPAPQINMDGKAVSDSVTAQQSYNRGIR